MLAVFQHGWLHFARQWTQSDGRRPAEPDSGPLELQLSGGLLPLALL